VIAAVDSSADMPTLAAVAEARAAGVVVWGGYLATKLGVRLYAPWPREAFEVARLCGGRPLAFCSGLDDPISVRELAAAWDVLPCLDVEAGIRGDGAWVDGWLTDSGAGLYGVLAVHYHDAPFHIAAMYPGYDVSRTWPTAKRPPTPCGWQWRGTHRGPGGLSVDSLLLDDWFGPAPEPAPTPPKETRSMPITVKRADGGNDWFGIVGTTLHHVALDAYGAAHFNDLVPGAWAQLLNAWWDGPSLVVRGLGVDGALWKCTWTDGTWAQPVSGLG
jgi:hypothetical protein